MQNFSRTGHHLKAKILEQGEKFFSWAHPQTNLGKVPPSRARRALIFAVCFEMTFSAAMHSLKCSHLAQFCEFTDEGTGGHWGHVLPKNPEILKETSYADILQHQPRRDHFRSLNHNQQSSPGVHFLRDW